MSNLRKYEVVREALILIKQNNGQMRSFEIFNKLKDTFPQNDYERELSQSGVPRWENWLSFFSIDAVKTGYLIKSKGYWHITEEGENALFLSVEEFASSVKQGYINWRNNNKKNTEYHTKEDDVDDNVVAELDVVQAQASKGIRDYIFSKNPYEFQDIVAALLRAMGYYTPFIAPKGKDGGVDIIAYRDPLGASLPRVKVQVKHYTNNQVDVNIVRNLIGVLAKEGEIGAVITSSTFTNDAIKAARNSHTPMRLIDIDEFISLWLQYYSNMGEEDKNLLPITPVYFVNPDNN